MVLLKELAKGTVMNNLPKISRQLGRRIGAGIVERIAIRVIM